MVVRSSRYGPTTCTPMGSPCSESPIGTAVAGRPVSVAMPAQTSGLGFLMAQAVFASVPILVVYVFFQKYIVRAVSGAAVR